MTNLQEDPTNPEPVITRTYSVTITGTWGQIDRFERTLFNRWSDNVAIAITDDGL